MSNIEDQQRCGELKSRLRATQEQNECMFTLIERTKKMIQRARLERALLLEKIEQTTRGEAEDVTPPQSPLIAPSSAAFDDEDALKRAGAAGGQAGGNSTSNKLPNAYTVFCDEERERVTNELTSEAGGQVPKTGAVQKTLSERWKLVSKEDRKQYTEKAKEIKRKESEVKEESD